MRRNVLPILFLFFVLYPVSWASLRKSTTLSKTYELTPLLENCAGYCEKLSHASLYFVCIEEVNETINTIIYPSKKRLMGLDSSIHFRTRPIEKNQFVYDYQLIRKDGAIDEKRILLKEAKKEVNERNAPLKTKRFTYKYVIFGPIGLLSRKAQLNHTYKVINEEKYKGQPVLVIRVTPIEKQKVKHLYGDVWIRKKDFAILKIEWNQQSLKNLELMRQEAEQYHAEPRTVLVSEYNYEHKGILFPNKYSIKEMYYFKSDPGRVVKSKIEVNYRNYKFFTVETDIK